jgi:hypothetical protein
MIVAAGYVLPEIGKSFSSQCAEDLASTIAFGGRIAVVLLTGAAIITEIFLFHRQIDVQRNLLRFCEWRMGVLRLRRGDLAMGGEFRRNMLRRGTVTTMVAPFALTLLVALLAMLEIIRVHGCTGGLPPLLVILAFVWLLYRSLRVWGMFSNEVAEQADYLKELTEPPEGQQEEKAMPPPTWLRGLWREISALLGGQK